jgi:hypothetical protein
LQRLSCGGPSSRRARREPRMIRVLVTILLAVWAYLEWRTLWLDD